ncbi:hypothetical protein EYF80_011357 [Liparis tanakae]|uniref:Uncharacterized protein n=1 Tax=Liparis tanakae TaxID=230148 RepID=A0A4Z2IMJ5_9TELE|nr:hypothetical protein EYF80_011357 [Liparis tanakae]
MYLAVIKLDSKLSIGAPRGRLLCGVCIGKARRSLLLRWCCGIFSGVSCCRSDSSSRSYITLCSSRAVRFSSRYCFSSTWTTFCMGSKTRDTTAFTFLINASSVKEEDKRHKRLSWKKSLHYDLHLSKLIAVVLLRRRLAGGLHICLNEALSGGSSVQLL